MYKAETEEDSTTLKEQTTLTRHLSKTLKNKKLKKSVIHLNNFKVPAAKLDVCQVSTVKDPVQCGPAALAWIVK